MARGVGLEFKQQYHRKKKKKEFTAPWLMLVTLTTWKAEIGV
jgi:hypothetical protein